MDDKARLALMGIHMCDALRLLQQQTELSQGVIDALEQIIKEQKLDYPEFGKVKEKQLNIVLQTTLVLLKTSEVLDDVKEYIDNTKED